MSEEIVVDGVVLVASLSIAVVDVVAASPLLMVDKDDEATAAAAAAAAVKLAEDVDGSDGV